MALYYAYQCSAGHLPIYQYLHFRYRLSDIRRVGEMLAIYPLWPNTGNMCRCLVVNLSEMADCNRAGAILGSRH